MSKNNKFLGSIESLKSVKGISVAAMLIALSCVLSFCKFGVTPNVTVTLFFLPISVGAMLLGPFPAAMIGGIADLLGCFIAPTGPYFPGFTLNAIITGFVFGLFYFNSKPKIWKIIAARLTTAVIIDLILTPIWLHILYSTPLVWAFWVERFIKIGIVVPIEIILMIMINNAIYKLNQKLEK